MKRFPCVLGLLAVIALGCGPSGPNRQSLSGTVKYDGKPLIYGTIQFDPDTSRGQQGPQGAGEIRDGHYETNPGFGAVPGPHIVRITGWNSGPEQGMLGPPVVSEYETRVDLPASTTDGLNFDIPARAKKR